MPVKYECVKGKWRTRHVVLIRELLPPELKRPLEGNAVLHFKPSVTDNSKHFMGRYNPYPSTQPQQKKVVVVFSFPNCSLKCTTTVLHNYQVPPESY